MKTYKLNFHSFVDIITNSSTEIYTFPGLKAVELTYEMIQKLFDGAGIDKKAEDCYDVYYESDYDDDGNECEYSRVKVGKERVENVLDNMERNPGLYLIIKSKINGDEIDLGELSDGIFQSEEFDC